MFTPAQFDLMEAALTLARQHSGIDADALEQLGTAIDRERLIHQDVRFTRDGIELTGTLQDYQEAPDGTLKALVSVKDHLYAVDTRRELLGAAE
jgi:hypothetical protein